LGTMLCNGNKEVLPMQCRMSCRDSLTMSVAFPVSPIYVALCRQRCSPRFRNQRPRLSHDSRKRLPLSDTRPYGPRVEAQKAFALRALPVPPRSPCGETPSHIQTPSELCELNSSSLV
jgi:hypothetical protein